MKARDYLHLANPAVSDLVPYTPGKPVEELERELGISDSIKLASNENPLGASPLVAEAIQKTLDGLNLYPDANGFYLKQALSEHHDLPPDCITLGNGSNDILVFLAQAFLNPEVAAVYSQYAFAVYPIVTQMMGAKHQVVPALPIDHPMALGHDLRAMYAAVDDDTRLVFIANPNNPTGTWLNQERLIDFVGSLPPHVICVIDEAYTEYGQTDVLGDASTWLDRFPNLVVSRTFSKAYGLAALRVGYALANPGITDLLNRVRPPFNVSVLGLEAARVALQDQAFIEKSRAMNEAGLAQLKEGLSALGVDVSPSAANFVLAHFGRPVDEINRGLMKQGVIVRPVGNYGLDQSLRITIGTPEQNTRLLNALASVLEKM